MKISGIDRGIENIIYYLDDNGFKPFASCDGIEENHNARNKPVNGYISFLKSPKIIDLMASFLNKKDIFSVMLKSGNYKTFELYDNMIYGTIYSTYFSNLKGENTECLETLIKQVVKTEEHKLDIEKKKLLMLEKILEENTNSNIVFEVRLNDEYQPYMKKASKINELKIIAQPEETQIDNNIEISKVRNINILVDLLCEKYNLEKKTESENEYPNEFIVTGFDKSTCSIYFSDKHFLEMLEQIQYVRKIEPELPFAEIKEPIYLEDDEFDYDIEYLEER